MKSTAELLAEVMELKPPSRDYYGFDDLGYERYNGACSQYEEMIPLIRDLAVAMERTELHSSDMLGILREVMALNERYDKLLTDLLEKTRPVY